VYRSSSETLLTAFRLAKHIARSHIRVLIPMVVVDLVKLSLITTVSGSTPTMHPETLSTTVLSSLVPVLQRSRRVTGKGTMISPSPLHMIFKEIVSLHANISMGPLCMMEPSPATLITITFRSRPLIAKFILLVK
jgi:hypothetical protein